jgi:hypothetical protein
VATPTPTGDDAAHHPANDAAAHRPWYDNLWDGLDHADAAAAPRR